MAQSVPLIQCVLASSVIAARRAGKIIRDVLSSGDLGIIDKGKSDLQTEADRSAQHCIISSLCGQFPGLAIIGEEGASKDKVPQECKMEQDEEVLAGTCPSEYANLGSHEMVVWVDPLDGTMEYTQGLVEHVTVLIGIAVRGKAVGGVIHQPYYKCSGHSGKPLVGRTLWGLVGMGVGGILPVDAPLDKLIVTTSRSHADELVELAMTSLKPDEIIKVGGSGYKVILLIEGKANAYVFASKGCKKWDTCAPEAILEAAGGKLTDVHGNRYNYEKNASFPDVGGVFATAKGMDHETLLSKLPQKVLDSLI